MSQKKRPFIVGVGGTTRAGSSTEKALRISLAAAEAQGAEVDLIAGPELDLPMYNPSTPARAPGAERLLSLLRRCDGVILASPAYHGSISGLMKNTLDYVADMQEDDRVYFDGVAVGLIATAGGWQGAVQTLATMRSIVHALRGWPTPMGAALNSALPLFDANGQCTDLSSKFQLETVGQQVMQFCRMCSTPMPSVMPNSSAQSV
ncbi:NADPH-dependent FMN reductase [Variovorax sp. KK3]|uniref:NADPH-dependent FMN reductase n=1 Tax=Variovorax sp. KK3 TaxID=1855728 RepID=UPI00097BE98A|nr:NAD(P)H-dependent oxidoreductase [Variovorax sp. KK3]